MKSHSINEIQNVLVTAKGKDADRILSAFPKVEAEDTHKILNTGKNSFYEAASGDSIAKAVKDTLGIDTEIQYDGGDKSGTWTVNKWQTGDFIKIEVFNMSGGVKDTIQVKVSIIKNGWYTTWVEEGKADFLDYAIDDLKGIMSRAKDYLSSKEYEILPDGQVRPEKREQPEL